MLRPASLWQQYSGKAQAEALRGNGIWPLQPHPCELEPPWESYNSRAVSVWDCMLNNWEGPWEGSWLRRTFSLDTPLFRNGQQLILPELQCLDYENLVPIVVEQFCEDETTIPKIQQFLLSLPSLRRPLSFEVMGWGPQPMWDHEKSKEIMQAQSRGEKRSIREAICGWEEPYTVVQFVADKADAAQVQNQLISHYPNSAIVIGENVYSATPGSNLQDANTRAATLLLDHVYCQPLRIFGKLDPDPLGVAIAAMEQLDKDDWALLQILFEPARNPWAETVTAALTNPYKPNEYLFNNVSEKMLREKFSSPLFAVSIRILASKISVYRQLEGWAQQFASPPQGLSPNKSSWEGNSMPEFERNYMSWSVDARCTHLPGMILNLNELASLVHLPSDSVVTERLRRLKTRTKAAPKVDESDDSIILGDNIHRGQKRIARIPASLRPRHCYVAVRPAQANQRSF